MGGSSNITGAKLALEEKFRDAMRRTASGVAVLTTDGNAGRAGVTVSTLCSLSLEPPSIIACVHKKSQTLGTIFENGCFVANVLADDQTRIAAVFSGPAADVQGDRFANVSWGESASGNPVIEGTLAAFDCKLATHFEFGSHKIIVGEVRDVFTSDRKPLIYSGRMFGKLEQEWAGIAGFM